ncbi:MAG: Zn-ribbon containing protein [Euryarchaeota archaeon]|nr:Zn-ribbon containing protein [Euryarchaeota archaeon]
MVTATRDTKEPILFDSTQHRRNKCTNRGPMFEGGSADILNGCPNCGWNMFLYVLAKPATETETDAEDTDVKMQSGMAEE